MCPSLIEIGSKTAEKNSAQTNRQTDRHYENNGHLAVNQKAYDALDVVSNVVTTICTTAFVHYGRPVDADIIFLPCGFFFYLSFFPRLISAVADWMSTILPHMVWPSCEFRMQVWNVLHVARWKYRTQKIAKNSPSGHHRTTLSGYIFATKARIDNRKKKIKQQYLLQMSSQYGELRPTSGWDRSGSLRHPY